MTTVNILDMKATVHVNKLYASLVRPEHVVAVIEGMGFELKENATKFSVFEYTPNSTRLMLQHEITHDWHLRLSEILEDLECATGEKEIRTLWRFLKQAGHEVVME